MASMVNLWSLLRYLSNDLAYLRMSQAINSFSFGGWAASQAGIGSLSMTFLRRLFLSGLEEAELRNLSISFPGINRFFGVDSERSVSSSVSFSLSEYSPPRSSLLSPSET